MTREPDIHAAVESRGHTITPAGRISGIRAYGSHKRPARVIDLKLDANEGPGPDRAALEPVLAEATRLVRLYPVGFALEPTLADRFGVDAEQIVVTAGADDALERVCRAMLEAGRNAVAAVPTFEMIPRYVSLAGGALRSVPWARGDYPLAQVLKQIDDHTRVIFLVTPNNPTGTAATATDLRALSAAAPNAVIVLDAAYAEFADDDLTAIALSLPNAVVLRTLSKAWGLAGLRVGFAMGHAEHIDWLRRVGQPYAVSTFALVAAKLWLDAGRDAVMRGVTQVQRERVQLESLIQDLGAEAVPSQANFVLMRSPRAKTIAELLAGLGIGVRSFPHDDSLQDAIRISCPADEAAFQRLSAGLRTAMKPDALLFDMDGVLADVSGSYREAIIRTCSTFRVDITRDAITKAKARGNANNDWELSQRLLADAGVNASLGEVTRRFEALYQGDGQTPGLRLSERLLVDRATLERMARRVKLGVVTGRPRRDAERFLTEHGIADLFGAVVCMEDGPLKPDPATVRIACMRLGASHAWMLGDTVDDVRASRAAGVVAIGSIAPGESFELAEQTLLRAGAGLVLPEARLIEELLP